MSVLPLLCVERLFAELSALSELLLDLGFARRLASFLSIALLECDLDCNCVMLLLQSAATKLM